MEDYALDIIIGKGPSARSVRIELPKFTLVGATTRAGALAAPLRDRFGIVSRLEYYKQEELEFIVTRAADILNIGIEQAGASENCSTLERNTAYCESIVKTGSRFCTSCGEWRYYCGYCR